MRILLITYEYPPHTSNGGIATYSENIVGLWLQSGFSVIVFSANPNGQKIEILEKENYRNFVLPVVNEDDFRQASMNLFIELSLDSSVDLIECPETGAAALDIKREFKKIPLIVKLHSPGVLINKINKTYQSNFIKLRFVLGSILRGKLNFGYWSKTDKNKSSNKEYQICELADYLFSPSDALAKWVEKYWRISNKKITIVPNPILLNNRYFDITIAEKTNQIAFIGKLSVLKGVYTLTPALKYIAKTYPDLKFKIIGRDEVDQCNNLSMLEFMKNHLGDYLDRIEFTGPLVKEELYDIYKNSIITIVPSLWENYPSVILEAMASKCCVVASDVGGIPEIIENAKTGFLFPPKEYKKLVRLLKYIIDNPKKRNDIVSNACDEIKRRMKYDSSYEEIILPYLEAFSYKAKIT